MAVVTRECPACARLEALAGRGLRTAAQGSGVAVQAMCAPHGLEYYILCQLQTTHDAGDAVAVLEVPGGWAVFGERDATAVAAGMGGGMMASRRFYDNSRQTWAYFPRHEFAAVVELLAACGMDAIVRPLPPHIARQAWGVTTFMLGEFRRASDKEEGAA